MPCTLTQPGTCALRTAMQADARRPKNQKKYREHHPQEVGPPNGAVWRMARKPGAIRDRVKHR